MIKIKKTKTPWLNQGDIIADVEYIESVVERVQGNDRYVTISKIKFPLIIVMTQICDLYQDFINHKDKSKEKKWISIYYQR